MLMFPGQMVKPVLLTEVMAISTSRWSRPVAAFRDSRPDSPYFSRMASVPLSIMAALTRSMESVCFV